MSAIQSTPQPPIQVTNRYSLHSLPIDLIKYCIVAFLNLKDKRSFLSTSKPFLPQLREFQHYRIDGSAHSVLWKCFISHTSDFAAFLGLDSIKSHHRKLSLHIENNTFKRYSDLIIPRAHWFQSIEIRHSPNVPLSVIRCIFEGPTQETIRRYFASRKVTDSKVCQSFADLYDAIVEDKLSKIIETLYI